MKPPLSSADRMTPLEMRATASLAGIFSTRMLGLFLILPVFALYAEELEGTTPLLIGVTLGAYGLSQALLQIPYGMVSDRLGRKPVIAFGLVVFALGSALAAVSDSIYGVLAGRILQGAGAIAAVVMALLADLTREEHRTKAMAIIGMSIGASFAFSLVAGPIFAQWIGVDGIFWVIALLAIGGLVVLYTVVPTPVASKVHRDAEPVPALLKSVLADGQLLRLDFGIMALHIMMTASFVVLPPVLRDYAMVAPERHWLVYLPVLLASVIVMVPFIIYAEKKRRVKEVFIGAVVGLVVASLVLFGWHDSLAEIVLALIFFFAAFNLLEAMLPSLVARTVSPDRKGTAMGVYSSSQFLGAFIGGTMGGWLRGSVGPEGVFAFCAALALVWVAVAVGMRGPRYLTTQTLRVGPMDSSQAQLLSTQLSSIPGVAEVTVIAEDGIAYVRVDDRVVDREALRQFATAEAA